MNISGVATGGGISFGSVLIGTCIFCLWKKGKKNGVNQS